jgi:hypothetical protein
MDEAIADIIRKAMRDEASGIDGLGTQVPSPSPIARWPFWSESEAGEDAC